VAVLSVVLYKVTRQPSYYTRYFLGGSIIAVLAFAGLAAAGLSNVLRSYQITSSLGIFAGGVNKFWELFTRLLFVYRGGLLLLPGLMAGTAVYIFRKTRPAICSAALAATPFLIALIVISAHPFIGSFKYLYAAVYITLFGLTAPYLFMFVRERSETRALLWLVWVPGFVAGLTFAYTSSNGERAAAVGLFQGFIVSSIFLWKALEDMWPKRLRGALVVRALPLFFSVLLLLTFQYSSSYRDDPLPALTAKVASGPYVGLYTTPVKRDYLAALENDMIGYGQGAKTVLVFDEFPAGYLLSGLTPETNWTWIGPMTLSPNVDRNTVTAYLKKQRAYPDMIVRVNTIIGTKALREKLSYPPNDPLNNLVESESYYPVAERANYTIFRRRL
jgi:hypothetical protein